MKFIERLRRRFNDFENLLFKNYVCLCCSVEVSDELEIPLCDDCLKGLLKIDGKVCVKCGEKLLGDVMVCDACKGKDYAFDGNTSCFYYAETAGDLIKKFKYSSKKYYAETLAKLMEDKAENFGDVDLVTFVPISKKRRRERGFNQAELLATEFSKLIKKETESLLIKDDGGKHQAGLGRTDRLTNLNGTIHVDSEKGKLIKGKTILIVDDVFTTGTTLSLCASEIKKYKPKQVKTLTFAKTKFVSSK